MDFMYYPNSQCLLSFISKWLSIEISIYHVLMVNALKKLNLWNENYQTFHMVHKHDSKYVNHMWNKY